MAIRAVLTKMEVNSHLIYLSVYCSSPSRLSLVCPPPSHPSHSSLYSEEQLIFVPLSLRVSSSSQTCQRYYPVHLSPSFLTSSVCSEEPVFLLEKASPVCE